MTPTAARDVADEWIRTWAHVRGLATASVDGWTRLHVRSLSRETELICVDPGVAQFRALLRHVVDPRTMLTVVARDIGPYRTASLPPNLRVDRDDETLMSTTLAFTPLPRLGSAFTTSWDVDQHGLSYGIDAGPRNAARGTVGTLDDVATFDEVETIPRFQRLGLGRHVMTALTNAALDRGATRGVLAASPDGRRLYGAMGWRASLQMLSVTGN